MRPLRRAPIKRAFATAAHRVRNAVECDLVGVGSALRIRLIPRGAKWLVKPVRTTSFAPLSPTRGSAFHRSSADDHLPVVAYSCGRESNGDNYGWALYAALAVDVLCDNRHEQYRMLESTRDDHSREAGAHVGQPS